MSNSACGSMELIEGGVIRGASIINSQISDSAVSNSTLTACTIQSLASIDAVSAQTIANAIAADATATKTLVDAIAGLPPDQLVELARVLHSLFTAIPAGLPAQSAGAELPTTVIGNRAGLLGLPPMFAKFDDNYIVPVYRTGM